MRINIVHAMPAISQAFGRSHDGFTAAIELLAEDHSIKWLNVHPANHGYRQNLRDLADCDFVLVQSDWGWIPARAADRVLFGRPEVPVGLVIAGSSPAPAPPLQLRYDVLFYETPWYAPFVASHPLALEAFGIDSRVMRLTNLGDREYDHIFVGRLASFKRPEEMLHRSGRRLMVGDFSAADDELVHRLVDSGIELRSFVDYEDLADLYNNSRSALVPCRLQGGGERAVLEARACGCRVEIAPDNPKLQTLLTMPVPSHRDYAGRITEGLEAALTNRPVPLDLKRSAQRRQRWEVSSDKVRRTPETVRIRARNLLKRH